MTLQPNDGSKTVNGRSHGESFTKAIYIEL